jgi:selT/selW/selH-like putative selenoprotein
LTAKLLPIVKQAIARYTLIPSQGGCFELRVGSDLVYSKRKTGKFPDEQEMIDAVRRLVNL